jgi:hypothetical protein
MRKSQLEFDIEGFKKPSASFGGSKLKNNPIQIKKAILWPRFIRELTGRLAQFLQNLDGQQTAESFWDHRPFTRVVAGRKKPFQILKEYLYFNHLEAEGHINRQEMGALRDLRAFLSG